MKKNNLSYFASTVLLPSFLIYCLIFYNGKNGIFEGVEDIPLDTSAAQKNDSINPNIDNKETTLAEKGVNTIIDTPNNNLNESENNIIDNIIILPQQEQKTNDNTIDNSHKTTNNIVIQKEENNQEKTVTPKNNNEKKENSSVDNSNNTPSSNNNTNNENNSNNNTNTNNNSNATETYNNNDALAYETLNIINSIRLNNGLNQFSMDNTLIQIAGIRAKEITIKWSHTRPNGTEWWTLFSEFRINGMYGENLAFGQKSASEVVNDWMLSQTHRDNILNGRFNKIGIFVLNHNGTYYWVQEFLG